MENISATSLASFPHRPPPAQQAFSTTDWSSNITSSTDDHQQSPNQRDPSPLESLTNNDAEAQVDVDIVQGMQYHSPSTYGPRPPNVVSQSQPQSFDGNGNGNGNSQAHYVSQVHQMNRSNPPPPLPQAFRSNGQSQYPTHPQPTYTNSSASPQAYLSDPTPTDPGPSYNHPSQSLQSNRYEPYPLSERRGRPLPSRQYDEEEEEEEEFMGDQVQLPPAIGGKIIVDRYCKDGVRTDNFLWKLWNYILSNPHNNIINWSPSGKYLVIPNEQILIEEVVVVLWKQKDYSSFARQLNIYGFKRVAPAQMKDIEEPFPTGSKVWQHEFLVRESSCDDVFRVRRHATNKKNPGKVRNSPGGAGTRRLGQKHRKWGRETRNEENNILLNSLVAGTTIGGTRVEGDGSNGLPPSGSRVQQIRDEESGYDEQYDHQTQQPGDIPVSDIMGAIRNTNRPGHRRIDSMLGSVEP